MRKIFLMLSVLALAAVSQDGSMPENPWFDHVRRPTSATHEELCALAKSLHKAFKEGVPAKKIAQLAPADTSPRAVFITIGGNTWPGRTYFGVGLNFASALEAAADYLISNEPEFAKETIKLAKATIAEDVKAGKKPAKEWLERQEHPTEWSWLKLDVVQQSKPVPGFVMANSRIALTSLVGFSFGPDMGYAFTPDQITGRCLITDTGHIAAQQVGNLISENYNWPALKIWMKLSAVSSGHRICLFETDTYYCDGGEACRLYRGHRLFDAPPDKAACRSMMLANAARLSTMVEGNGAIRPPMPAWISTAKDENEAEAKAKPAKNKKISKVVLQEEIKYDETLDAKAELAIAFARVARLSGEDSYNDAALRAMFAVIQATKEYGKEAAAVIENENLPEGSMLSPEKAALLRTNALACLALMELKANGKSVTGGIDKRIHALATHIRLQFTSGCDFYAGRYWNTGKPINDDVYGLYAQVEETALAVLALDKYARLYENDELAKLAEKILDDMLELKLVKLPIESLTLSPWFAEAVASRMREDRTYWLALLKLAGAITSMTDKAPLYPDYYGTVRRFPSCTSAAEHTWILAVISKRLRELDKPYLAREQLAEALPILMFQTQAFIDAQSSCILPNPSAYVSFFRDNLENYGFNLPGQVAQIMSLAAVSGELKETSELKVKPVCDEIAKVRKESDVHPGPLTVDLILTSDKDEDGAHRDLLGGVTQGEKIRKVLKPRAPKNKGTSTKSKAKRN